MLVTMSKIRKTITMAALSLTVAVACVACGSSSPKSTKKHVPKSTSVQTKTAQQIPTFSKTALTPAHITALNAEFKAAFPYASVPSTMAMSAHPRDISDPAQLPKGCEAGSVATGYRIASVKKGGKAVLSLVQTGSQAEVVYNVVLYYCPAMTGVQDLMRSFKIGMRPSKHPGQWFASRQVPAGANAYVETGSYTLTKGFGWGANVHLPASEAAENVAVQDGHYIFGVWAMAPSQALIHQFLTSFKVIKV